jgi:hypothetical protein
VRDWKGRWGMEVRQVVGREEIKSRRKEKANFMSYIASRLQSTITRMSHHLLICFHRSLAPSPPIPSSLSTHSI